MRILVNASNLKAGGGLQVADSVCRELYKFPQHRFTIVLSSQLTITRHDIEGYPNTEVYEYNVRNNLSTLVLGRDKFLDGLVDKKKIDAVMTVFGPSRWEPRCPHLCGFAMAFHVIPESPYYGRMGKVELMKSKIHNKVYEYFFQRTTKNFYTENPFITDRLRALFKETNVYTVTNYYNQVFDHPEQWVEKTLPAFDGTTLLTLSNSYPHKNLEITAEVARILAEQHPDFNFRFVISINREQMRADLNGIDNTFVFLGTVGIKECPSLYQQCDIAFQPTLIECFTATYPEAMRMERPIVTTDLEFARGLCGDAAEYYSAIDAQSCADAIYKVATDDGIRRRLVSNGKEQLKKFDNSQQRAEKLIKLVERL